ncbi:MAG: tyrosine-type recombinase/integrase [Pseudomonadota bacterium]
MNGEDSKKSVGERSTVNGEQSFDFLFKFKQHLTVLNRSAATIKAYINTLKVFLSALGETDMKRVTRSMVEDYVAGLSYKGYRTGSICVIVRSIKRFFEFLERTNVIFINPAESIREPKKETGTIRDVLTPQEARTILDQPNLGTLKGIRDRTIMEVFYSTGIRLSELCFLTIYDADLQGQTLRINQGKGKRTG